MEALARESEHTDASSRTALEALITPLREAILPYVDGQAPGVPGAQRAIDCFLGALEKWIANERWFCDGRPYADVVEDLRQAHKNDPTFILGVCRAHEQLDTTASLVLHILNAIGVGSKINPNGGAGSGAALAEIGSMGQAEGYRQVALRARQLLMQESKPSVEARKRQFLEAASDPVAVETLLSDKTVMTDILFPLLKDNGAQVGLIDMIMRQLYRNVSMRGMTRVEASKLVKFSFTEKSSEGALSNLSTVTSLVDLKRVVSSGSLSDNADESESSSVIPVKQSIPADTSRSCVCAIIQDFNISNDIWSHFTQLAVDDFVNVLYLVVLGTEVGMEEDGLDEVAKVSS